MTNLNTIIEEEKKVARRLFDLTLDCKLVPKDIEDAITTAMQRAYEAGQREEQERVREMAEALRTDPEANDVTDHFIADDAYESKVEAFFYGHNQALDTVLAKLTESDKTTEV